jgi:Ca2+-binding RTX toxin-like protein
VRGSLRLRLVATLAVAIALLGAAKLLAAAANSDDGPGSSAEISATGALSVSNSRDGTAIFAAANLSPGDTTEGEVTIGNTGTGAGALSLADSDLSDAPGVNGGMVSEMISLRVTEVTRGAADPVYSGGLAEMPELQLGALPAGSARTYRFEVSLAENGAASTDWSGDNAYQRASASVSYDWTLTEADELTSPPLEALPPDRNCGAKLLGGVASDRLTGTPGGDSILGHGGNDLIRGLAGDDCLFGGRGVDRLYGDHGNDQLRGGTGMDWLVGGTGSDTILARGRGRDRVRCGAGYDIALIDARDFVSGCEVARTH